MSVFVDSTTLIYPLDPTEPAKGAVCAAWLKTARDSTILIVSPQVLNETHSTIMKKAHFTKARSIIRPYLRDYFCFCLASPQTSSLIEDAWALQDRYGVQWWDALLLGSANAAGCEYFVSEDLNDGQVYGGVTAVNPFRHTPEDVLGRPLPR